MELQANYIVILPALLLVAGVFSTAFLHFSPLRGYGALVSILTLLASFCAVAFTPLSADPTFYGYIAPKSKVSDLSQLVTLATAFFVVCIYGFSSNQKKRDEFYSVFLGSVLGSIIMLSTKNWILFFIGLEIASILGYVLVAWERDGWAVEAAVKYFFLGTLSSAILLFGIALYFGATGQFSFTTTISSAAKASNLGLLKLSLLFIFIATGFKLALVPFHFWAPDVYRSASNQVTLYLMTVPKIPLIFLLNALVPAASVVAIWIYSLIAVGVLSSFVGNSLAFYQKDIKGVLSYSAISQIGLTLLLIYGRNTHSYFVLFYYIIAYIIANLGIFAILQYCFPDKKHIPLSDLKGLFHKWPISALLFSFFLFSLAGIPFTAGFLSKLFLLIEYIRIGLWQIVPVILLASVLGAIFYVKTMAVFFQQTTELNTPKEATELNAPKEANERSGFVRAQFIILFVVFAALSLLILFWPDAIHQSLK